MCNSVSAKIIALDLDDTLLKDDLTISDYTVSVLQEAVNRGIYITLCSGRTDNAILTYVRRLDIAGKQGGRYIIAQNGTSISDLHERKTIYMRLLDADILTHVYHSAAERGFVCEVYDASTIFVPYANEWTERDIKLSGLRQKIVPLFEEFLMQGHPKMVIPGEPDALAEFQAELQSEIGERCVIFTSKPYFLEVLPKNAGKGEALMWLAERLGIAQAETMAFGDGMNDETMIRLAGSSVAMKNGVQQIKDAAKYISEYTNDEDGVARFIEKYVLGKT